MSKIALLSNVNMNFAIRMLKQQAEVYEAEGYGNELGLLLNKSSSYHAFAPEITFLVLDLMELIEHDTDGAAEKIERWFRTFRGCADEKQIYYIGDGFLWAQELAAAAEPFVKEKTELIWREHLEALIRESANVRALPVHRMIEKLGEENAFSMKMWYLGKILFTNEAQKRLCGLMLHRIEMEKKVPKKVLLLDLDNTLWGGLAGEAEHTPVILSEEHGGLAYKNEQRVILEMQKQGVLLGIVSKNNEEDALAVLEKHPHMVLKPEHFAVRKINWKPKQENILQIAEELNLGLDSFVFWDDNPTERELIKQTLPEVSVPDFPEKPEELAPAMVEIYETYFEKTSVTAEDKEKTAQYAANAKRNSMQAAAVSFSEYLKQLSIEIVRETPEKHIERLTQLINKTNQFNLTTMRLEQGEVQKLLQEQDKKVYLYRVTDCFGDNGIVAAAIVKLHEIPVIEELVMSCRVMGKNIEYAIVEDMENDLKNAGASRVRGRYLPTAKNKPVEQLYEGLGYQVVSQTGDGSKEYEIVLADRPEREYYAKIRNENEE